MADMPFNLLLSVSFMNLTNIFSYDIPSKDIQHICAEVTETEKDFSSGRTERKNAPPARDSSSIIALSYHFPILYY